MERICFDIAEGNSLRSACSKKGRPSYGTVLRWVAAGSEARALYEAALRCRSELYAEEIVAIADTEPDSNRARVRMDARRWTASKLLPRVYGDQVHVEHTGADGSELTMTPQSLLEAGRSILFALRTVHEAQPPEPPLAITHVKAKATEPST